MQKVRSANHTLQKKLGKADPGTKMRNMENTERTKQRLS